MAEHILPLWLLLAGTLFVIGTLIFAIGTQMSENERPQATATGARLLLGGLIWPIVALYWGWRFARWLLIGAVTSALQLPQPLSPRPPIPARWLPRGSRLMGFEVMNAVVRTGHTHTAGSPVSPRAHRSRTPVFGERPRWVREGEDPPVLTQFGGGRASLS